MNPLEIHKNAGDKSLNHVYTKENMIIVEYPSVYTCLGQIPESNIPSAPSWSFSKATRKEAEKITTTKALTKSRLIGKTGPGPVYNPDPTLCLKSDPKWSFAVGDKLKPTAIPYNYYKIIDKISNPSNACTSLNDKKPAMKFKIAERVY